MLNRSQPRRTRSLSWCGCDQSRRA